MKIGKLNNWIQVVGMVGVIGSLVFVGLQLRQSQEIAIAAQYQARLDAASSHYAAILQSDPALRVVGKDLLEDVLADPDMPEAFKAWFSAQPPEELASRAIGAILFLKSHDNVYFQYQSGFLSEEAWAAMRQQLRFGLNDERTWVRQIYEEDPSVWRASYRALIEKILAESAPDQALPVDG